ncbi:MAG: Ribose transport system ATP-binding protein [Naasia sp.]|jgi:ribose transport system ATP-binding protein|uniref:sugar ABC transporter ATP-binding protein n=1 Tax=Naasia sp. TaxID=2546198 RepID=UPI0026017F18|nr:sugar ABC transporter ATP-binding protein [Naasia sp.]MCU1569440.1 Ribose transport system ATP-binding protein [Naasia sp.]
MAETSAAAGGAPLFEVRQIVKRYPGVAALTDVSVAIRRGQIHALLGENGAGKSTLIGVLSGITIPDSGEIRVDGEPVNIRRPKDAQALGVTTIHQELSLAPDLTVVENIFLGRETGKWGLINDRRMKEQVHQLCSEFGLDEDDMRRPVASLGALKQHVVEILKALVFDARLVILDEPTSGLADSEREALFEHMRALRSRGLSILWVTHRLDELYGLADAITVLRDGRHVATLDDPAAISPEDLVRLMVGGKASSPGAVAEEVGRTRWSGPQDEVLRLEGVSRLPVQNVSLTLKRGEILGVAGIAGAGRTELARLIFGADRREKGTIWINGMPAKIRSPRQAFKAGIALVPEERKTLGILGDFGVSKNISVSRLGGVALGGVLLDGGKESAVAAGYVRELGIKTPSVQQKIRNLSGGNQQKVIIARCLFTEPSILIIDEPTQGIDVGAKVEVYRLIYDFVDNGGAVIVISSELPELLRVADRVVVMREGQIAGEVDVHDNSGSDEDTRKTEEIMALAVRESVA